MFSFLCNPVAQYLFFFCFCGVVSQAQTLCKIADEDSGKATGTMDEQIVTDLVESIGPLNRIASTFELPLLPANATGDMLASALKVRFHQVLVGDG